MEQRIHSQFFEMANNELHYKFILLAYLGEFHLNSSLIFCPDVLQKDKTHNAGPILSVKKMRDI